jgi:uncharacterized protein YjbJ (UPF0337 family)
MNEHHVMGGVRDVAGRVQNAAGALGGEPSIELKGKAREAAGKLEGAYGSAVDVVSNAGRSVGRALQANPTATVLVAAAVGFVLGWTMHRGD